MCRSKIRIRDGRAKPIDLLAKYISAEDDDLSVEMHEPYTFLNGLTVTDMDDLLEDIKVCALQLDIRSPASLSPWFFNHRPDFHCYRQYEMERPFIMLCYWEVVIFIIVFITRYMM